MLVYYFIALSDASEMIQGKLVGEGYRCLWCKKSLIYWYRRRVEDGTEGVRFLGVSYAKS